MSTMSESESGVGVGGCGEMVTGVAEIVTMVAVAGGGGRGGGDGGRGEQVLGED